MNTLDVIIYTNGTFVDEKALSVNGNIVLQGDIYHDKIDAKIEGFLAALSYVNVKYTRTSLELSPRERLFKDVGFFDNVYDYGDDGEDGEEESFFKTFWKGE